MNILARISLVIIIAATTVVGCAPYKNTRVLEAEERVVTYAERVNGAEVIPVFCAEASPDALKTLAGSVSVEKQNVAALAAAYSESGANIGLRTHTIQLLRDQLYAICQGYANKGISAPAYQMLLTRNQRNTVALMAIEQLTGVLRTPAVALTGASTANQAKLLLELNAQLATAEEQYKKIEDKKSAAAVELEKTISKFKQDIERARAQMVAATSTAETVVIQQNIDAATIKEVAKTVESIANSVIGVNDMFYVCLDIYQTMDKDKVPANLDAKCKVVIDQTVVLQQVNSPQK